MEYLKILGEGTYGVVIHSRDHQTHEHFAIKAVKRCMDTSLNGNLMELDALAKLSGHQNVLKLEYISTDSPFIIDIEKNIYKFEKMFLIFQKADSDLAEIIKTNTLTFVEKRLVVKNILDGVEYIHSHNITHRDIKPKNILMFPGYIPKICDFGIARHKSSRTPYTPRICTKYYTPPEVLLKTAMNSKIDIWSTGVVIYELFNGSEFIKSSSKSQLESIIYAIPNQTMTCSMCDKLSSHISSSAQSRAKRFLNKRHLESFNREIGDGVFFEDLMTNILRIDPLLRYSASQCLDHVFFSQLRRQTLEKIEFDRTLKVCTSEYRHFGIKYIISNYYLESKTQRTVRIVFHSIDLFDKFMNVYGEDINNYVLVKLSADMCHYISLKFFSTMHSLSDMGSYYEFELSEDLVEFMNQRLISSLKLLNVIFTRQLFMR